MTQMAYVKVDIDKTLKELKVLEKEQFPFVLAKTLSDMAVGSQQKIRQEMPSRFTLRSRWEQMGVRIERAKKADVRSTGSAEAIVKHLDAHMALQETGGEKKATRKRSLAIPEKAALASGWLARGSSGAIADRYKPKALLKDYKKGLHQHGKRSGRTRRPKPFIVEHNGRVIIAVRRLESRYPIKYLYVLEKTAHVKPRFDFEKTVNLYVSSEFEKRFNMNMRAALADRKA